MLPVKECVRYHVARDEWREMPEIEEARSSHAVAVFNEQILTIGGKNEAKEYAQNPSIYFSSVYILYNRLISE